MIIEGIAASLPSRIVSNNDMIEMIAERSTEYQGDLEQMLETIRKLLEKSGLKERRWCNRHELPIDHVAKATQTALADSGLKNS